LRSGISLFLSLNNDILDTVFNLVNNVIVRMPKLQHGPDGKFTITISKPIVKAKGWNKGDEIGLVITDEINRPLAGDVFLRRSAPV
jgi:hypothetical protein